MAGPDKDFMRKLLAIFRTEAEEHLQGIISNIVLLEQAGGVARKDLVDRILRTLHTLKGAARSVSLVDMEALCHAMESVFSAIGASAGALAPAQFDTIHQAGALAQPLLHEPSGRTRNQAAAMVKRLERLTEDILSAAHAPKEETAMLDEPADDGSPATEFGAPASASADAGEPRVDDTIRVQSKDLDSIRSEIEALLSVELGLRQHVADLLGLADDIADYRDQMRLASSGSHRSVRKPGTDASARPARVQATESDQYHSKLEMRCRSLAGRLGRTSRNFMLTRSKVMDAMLETALAPFSLALNQVPGLVRNLARSQGKEVAVKVEGEHICIDRRILDMLREALIHLITNAVDHGIEPAAKRVAAGKPAEGTITIRISQHSSNKVSVSIADDGMGIDLPGITAAALNAGNINADQIATLDERQKLHLTLNAGVSTSAGVTQVSGRGVGLAIVAEKVAATGGGLVIENRMGQGCTFQLLLPVRLATLRGLVLRTGSSLYLFPLSGIESVRAMKNGDIETVENRETLLTGGRIIPVVRLGHLLGIERAHRATSASESIAVIARAGRNTFALLVDEILSEQEVLPKSLGKQLRRIRFITGATQLGDGSLIPILGLEDIARYGLAADAGPAPANADAASASAIRRLLVAEDSITSRLLLKHILESAGYEVVTAVDGLEALSKLRQENFDAVISDVEMPRLDGFGLAERIRADPAMSALPVILVTTLQSPEEKERGLQAGADAYVVKGSFDQDNLLATVRRLI
jgi:two-component system chemotaxis sensor kinase CheA